MGLWGRPFTVLSPTEINPRGGNSPLKAQEVGKPEKGASEQPTPIQTLLELRRAHGR